MTSDYYILKLNVMCAPAAIGRRMEYEENKN